jgi:hypothetical protein
MIYAVISDNVFIFFGKETSTSKIRIAAAIESSVIFLYSNVDFLIFMHILRLSYV